MTTQSGFLARFGRDLEAPIEARGFGTGWFAGFFANVLAMVRDWVGFRVVIHLDLLAAYALALLSVLLRPQKVLGMAALVIALGATILGGAAVQPAETHN